MSVPSPTGNPLPYPPKHDLYDMPENLAWIKCEQREGESVEETLDRIDKELTEWLRKS
jgi:hypothetical protein